MDAENSHQENGERMVEHIALPRRNDRADRHLYSWAMKLDRRLR